MTARSDRRSLIKGAASLAAWSLLSGPALARRSSRKPNFILILCDDLGYGDLDTPLIRTPNIDRMRREGVTLTDFYAPAYQCTPSRAGCLTGRYPVRTGLGYSVLFPRDTRGLPPEEVTIAEALQPEYKSALIGKWHLGHVAPYWPPTRQGFDLFFGLPYSHDMMPLSLYEAPAAGVEFTSEDVDLPALEQRYWERAARFITEVKDEPFFLMLALTAPHVPNLSKPGFDHSRAGPYGDDVEEVDSIVELLTSLLQELDIAEDTLVILSSDNGPSWNGSGGILRGRKAESAFEGGYRVPFVAWQPGTIPRNRHSNAISMGIDLLPTFLAMAGKPLPMNVEIDGRDLSRVLLGAASPHEQLLLFSNEDVVAVRTQRWKYIDADYLKPNGQAAFDVRSFPMLADLENDPGEAYNFAARHPDVIEEMRQRFDVANARFAPFKLRR